MARPKGSKNKPKTTEPGSTDEPQGQDAKAQEDAGKEETELPTEPPEAIPNDLADVPVDDAIRSKDLDVLSEVIADINRIETTLENESKAKAAEYRKRLSTIESRRKDVLQQIDELTHTWEIDHENGVARMVSVRTGQVKMTRGLHPSEKQVEIPFGQEG